MKLAHYIVIPFSVFIVAVCALAFGFEQGKIVTVRYFSEHIDSLVHRFDSIENARPCDVDSAFVPTASGSLRPSDKNKP